MRDHKFSLVGNDPQEDGEPLYCDGCNADIYEDSEEECQCGNPVFERMKEERDFFSGKYNSLLREIRDYE